MKQHEFDAVVMLSYVNGLIWDTTEPATYSSELLEEFTGNSGSENPIYIQKNIIDGFTYTRMDVNENGQTVNKRVALYI